MTSLVVGQEIGRRVVRLTRADLVRYAGASGDFNPIHWSDRAAAELGLPGVLAHGMLTMGLALRVVTDVVDAERVVAYSVRFTRPVVVPDDDAGVEIDIAATVSAVRDGIATITLDVTCGGATVLGKATVEVRG